MRVTDWAYKPDWVMLGTPTQDGRVRLLASKKLTYGELQYEHDRLSASLTLTAGLGRDCVIIDAPDYPAALAELWKVWQPEPAQQRSHLAGKPQIEGPR
jgi:hypothetical protein